MRARFIIYSTGGGPDPPPPPPDPSIAAAAAKREAVAIVQAQQRRSGKYGSGASQLSNNSARPKTDFNAPAPVLDKSKNAVYREVTIEGENGPSRTELQLVSEAVDLTAEQKAVNAAKTLDYSVEKLMARRNNRIGVSSTTGV